MPVLADGNSTEAAAGEGSEFGPRGASLLANLSAPVFASKAARAHLIAKDGGNAKGLSGTILAMCFAARALP
jgi:hypothetical protein